MALSFLQIGIEEDTMWGGVDPVTVKMDRLIPDNHSFLLQFLDYDLSKAEKPLAEYLACLDSGKDPRKQLLLTTISELQQMHPYFLICRENAALMLNRIIAGYIIRHCKGLDELEQKNLFLKVCVSDYSVFTDPDVMFDSHIDAGVDYVLDYLYTLQDDIRKWVFLTLDNTNPDLAKLSSSRRSALYSHIALKDTYHPILSVGVEFSTTPSKKMLQRTPEWDFNEDHYIQMYQDLNALTWNPEGEIPKSIADIISATKDVDDCNTITYCIRDFSNLLELEVHRMVIDEIRIKRCKNCRRYFLPERSNQDYCSRLAPNSKSKLCSEIGRFLVHGKKAKESDPAYALFIKAYRARLEKIRRGTLTRDSYDRWRVEAKEKLEQTRQKQMTLDEFEEWLKI